MKKQYFLFVAFLVFGFSKAQIINFPDANFKSRLITMQVPSVAGNYAKNSNGEDIIIDINQDGEIQVSEALTVSGLGFSMGTFNSIEGIQSFTNLRDFKMFIINGLFNLDELNTLTGLTSIDVATCTNLVSLNFNPLINLNYVEISTLNNLTSLFLKNCKNETLDLSFLPVLEFICADETQISDIQSLVSASCVVNSYCSFTPGGTFYTIQGNNTYDSNGNGCDASDIAFPNMKYAVENGAISGNVVPTDSGSYSIAVQAGSHTVTPIIENPNYFTITPPTSSVTFPATESPAIRNFCVTANGIHNDVEVIVLPIGIARPGFNAFYKIMYKNKGTNSQFGTINFVFNDAIMDLVSSNPSISSQTFDNLNWNFTNLQPLESREILVTFNLNSPMETPPLNIGSVLNFDAIISGLTDETPADNLFVLNQGVVNSFDPNDKTCLEGTTITPEMVGKEVHYLIRFENNGTANAQNIVVKDMIDTSKFDVNSLIPIKGSHSFTTRISETNKVEFVFENINLPFDDANNDGFVAFKLKTKSNLVLGDTFSNSANIYFDYNFPIITNNYATTVALLAKQDFEFDHYFSLSPSPAQDVLHIVSKDPLVISSVNLYNALGQLIFVATNPNQSIDVSNLKTGMYFIKINAEKGSAISRFVKE